MKQQLESPQRGRRHIKEELIFNCCVSAEFRQTQKKIVDGKFCKALPLSCSIISQDGEDSAKKQATIYSKLMLFQLLQWRLFLSHTWNFTWKILLPNLHTFTSSGEIYETHSLQQWSLFLSHSPGSKHLFLHITVES